MTLASDFWSAPRGPLTQGWIHEYWTSQDQPHHLLLVQELARLNPASVLEVGCHCGVNLRALSVACPECRLAGFDVSADAIADGRRRLAECGIDADLRVGRAPEALNDYGDDCVEWACSCYTLAYVDPKEVSATLAAMWRVSSKGIVLFEPTAFDLTQAFGFARPEFGYREFRHPYLHLMSAIPGMTGALATIHEVAYPDNALNALIVVVP